MGVTAVHTKTTVARWPSRPLDTVRRRGRTLTAWGLTQALPKVALRRAAAAGDLAATLTTDPRVRLNPFDTYEQLRAKGPVVRGRLVWGSVEHAVCDEVLRSSAFGVTASARFLPERLNRVLERVTDHEAPGPIDPPSLLAVDPPLHTRYRRLVSRSFTARAVAAHTARIEQTADELLDAIGDTDTFDLVDRYAALLPVTVIADIIGVPNSMRDQFLDWGNAAALTLDPGLSWSQYRRAESGVRQLHEWLDVHLERLRRDPGDDVISQVLCLEGDDALTPVEVRALALLLLGAGFETTVNLIGNAVGQLFDNPDQRELVAADPSLWPNVVEETLRFDSPVQLTGRIANESVEVAGTVLQPGSAIMLLLGGANRDPKVFEDPQRFDVTRSNAGAHLAFSAGAHYCLGAGLARLEATVALRKLFERFPDLGPAGPRERRDMRVLRGYEHLPVRL